MTGFRLVLTLLAMLVFSSTAIASTKDVDLLAKSAAGIETIQDLDEKAETYYLVGKAFYRSGNSIKAEEYLTRAIELLETKSDDPSFAASVHNNMGLALISRANLQEALAHFQSAYEFARAGNNPDLTALSGINLARTLFKTDSTETLPALLDRIKTSLDTATPSESTARHWLSYGQLLRNAILEGIAAVDRRLDVLKAYRTAKNQASAFQNQSLIMYSKGYLGELYEDEARFEEAISYTREAIFDAQEQSDDISLYQWQWQLARLFKKQGDESASVKLYRQAVATVRRARTSLTLGSGVDFKQQVAPVYFEFVDLLLKRSKSISDKAARQKSLEEVIDVLESVKLAEVENYFDGQCVVLPDQTVKFSEIDSNSALLYPVLLQDRTEILVQLPSGIRQFTVEVSASRLRKTVNQFRSLIETYDRNDGFMGPAHLLYSWLIKPAERAIAEAGVQTLVLVPDGPLRSIPISALHDGQRFLIQKYALATTPGIQLTDPEPFDRQNIRVLASGLTEAVQGYSALPSVQKELDNISSVFKTTQYQNESYQLRTVAGEMSAGNYDIVHFATHGEFNSDHTKSFLLTYDNKLTMSQLESTIGLRRFQSTPIDLLVLSACQTAVGDERAALGLAGVALQAGARSALATLWYINDQATSALVADFYRQLATDGQTKAKALQAAQINMIAQPRFSHPSFWAPFLMIGNWM